MKNQPNLHKRIIGVIFGIAVAISLFHIQSVNAFEYCKDPNMPDGGYAEVPESTLIGRYGLNLEVIDSTTFKLTMNPSTNKEIRCEKTFKLAKINGADVDGDTLSCSHDVVFHHSSYIDDTSSGLPGITVTLTAEDIVKNEREESSCVYKYGSVTFEATVETAPTIQQGSCPAVQMEDSSISINFIDCNNQYQDGSFEQKFCYAKTHAEKTYNDSSSNIVNGKYAGDGKDLIFTCNHDVTQIPMNPEELEGENYYVNKHYIYGETVQPYTMGHYLYHYSPGEETVGETISCEITCEEAVEVEYGPPVASSAGMCFEYKVRVTSRVSCNMTKTPTPPDANCDYCTPSPHCVSSSGRVWLQGGPNEEFDACVQDCDGGKYTSKCSQKCYKKVYGSTIRAGAQINNLFLEDIMATQLTATGYSLEDCLSMTDENGYKYNPTGCYYRSGGAIKWKASGERFWYGNLETTGEGRWYTENPNGKYHNGSYIQAQADGFWRRNYGTDYCHDNCTWIACAENQYINKGMAEKDYLDNIEKYNQAVVACRGKATCSTTTAEFTISTDYTKKDGTEVTIDFPTYGTDWIQHNGSAVTGTYSEDNTTILLDEPAVGEGTLGCYKNGSDKTNLYRTTWSYPGTWMNLKTGEISYEPKPGSPVWFKADRQFCLPGDAKAVNVAWTNAYLHRKLEVNGLLDQVSVTDTEIDNVCHYTTSQNSVVNKSYNITEDQITYNIHAKTTNFGYFNWDISMECFYGISEDPLCSDPCCETGTCDASETDPDCVPNKENYRVRSTDTEDLFPSTDGSTKGTDEAGRLPGFNWSQYAVNNKNTEYKSNPVKYMEALQKYARDAKASGKEIYSSDNLDYEFYLSPKTIREMRRDVAGNMGGGNYTAFSDSGFSVETGLGRYRSEKIRSLAGDNKIPDKPAIYCNNMLRYGSNECDPVHDEG